MKQFVNAWKGYQLAYPATWKVIFPPIEGVAFDSPDSGLFVEFSQWKASDAQHAAEQRMRQFPPHEARIAEQSADTLTLSFRQQQCSGQLRVRWREGEALVVMAQSRHGVEADLTELLARTLSSLQPVTPVARRSWQGPEQSCQLLCPEGWRVESLVRPDSTGIRQPWCRVSLRPDVFLALEPEFDCFSVPMQGLYPLLEGRFLPRWPGVRVLDFEDFGNPSKAEARLGLPDGSVRVLKLSAVPMPGGPGWVGGLESFYQAPAAQLAELECVLRGIRDSYQINPQWSQQQRDFQQIQFNQSQQQSQQWMQMQTNLHQQRMHDIHMQGQHNTAMHQNRQEIADMQFQGFQQRMDSSDRQQHERINLIREHSDYVDPQSGRVFNIEDGHQRVWSDGHDQLFGGDWNVKPPPDWHELKPLRD